MSSILINVKHPRCPYCHDPVDSRDLKEACPTCMAWHHKECYQEHKGCSACGRKINLPTQSRPRFQQRSSIRRSDRGSDRGQRLFWAFETPTSFNATLEEIQDDLRESCSAVVRWNKAKFTPFHGTLKFIGGTRKGPEIIEKAESLLATVPPLNLQLTHVGQFGGSNPTVVWCGVGGKNELELKDLFRDFDNGLASLGIRKERHSYNPHITLGYVAKRQSSRVLRELTTAAQQRFLPANLNFEVSHLTLFESTKERGELVYKTVARLPLRG